MSTTIESSRMSDLTPFQEAAAWIAGIGTASAGAITVWSRIMRGLSADSQAINNDKAGKQLYDLLVNENKRTDERNRELELRNDQMLDRLNQLEIVHSKLLRMTSENHALRGAVKSKNQQLTMLLQQQSADRKEASSRFKEYETIISELSLKINSLVPPPTPGHRIDDRPHQTAPLDFGDNQ